MTTDPQRLIVVAEVTDTLSIDYTTGIQRVVREVLCGLMTHYGDQIEVVPVVEAVAGRGYRRLTADEERRLWFHPAGGRAGRRADNFGPLAPIVRRVGDFPITIKTRIAIRKIRRKTPLPVHSELAYGEIPAGAVFFDLEGSWYDPTPRARLLPRLAARDVRLVGFVHDVMPVIYSEWFTPAHAAIFDSWLDAHLRNDGVILTNSARTTADVAAVAVERGIDAPQLVPVPLGGDRSTLVEPDDPSGSEGAEPGVGAADGAHDRGHSGADASGPDIEAVTPVPIPDGLDRYLLVVGTLEPRKNQEVVLDAFEALMGDHPDLGLVLVGKEGWMVDNLVARIRTHPELDRRLLWLGGIDDAELAWLYANAFITVVPSIYEGLGVPVIESMQHGTPTIASTGGALPEAAGGSAELFEPHDTTELIALIRRHLEEPAHHAAAALAAEEHVVPTWKGAVDVVAATLLGLPRNAGAPG